MSFMSKLAYKFADALGDKDKDKDKHNDDAYAAHSYPPQGPHEGYAQQQYSHESYGSYEGYSQPPQSHLGGPPPSGPPGSHLPPGWIQQWDANSQRYYYLEQATGRTQWEPPHSGHAPVPGVQSYGNDAHGHDQSRDMYGGRHAGSYGHDSYSQGHNSYGQGGYPEHQGEKDGKGGMIAAGLGGAALGAIGGAVISHEMTEEDSDGEMHTTTVVTQPAYVPPPSEEISGSDTESIHEAQEDVQDAQEELAEASSESDREEAEEELEEAQEEYEEEVEGAYD